MLENPDSGTRVVLLVEWKILPAESRIMGFGIWNLTNDWSSESSISRHQRLEFWPGIRDPWHGIWNPTILDSLTLACVTSVSSRVIAGAKKR